MTTNLHPMEEVVEALVEAYQDRLATMVAWAKVDGRPMFTRKLTPDEQYARFADPQLRAMVLADITQTEGQAAADSWVADMMRLAGRLQRGLPPEAGPGVTGA